MRERNEKSSLEEVVNTVNGKEAMRGLKMIHKERKYSRTKEDWVMKALQILRV